MRVEKAEGAGCLSPAILTFSVDGGRLRAQVSQPRGLRSNLMSIEVTGARPCQAVLRDNVGVRTVP